MSRHFWRSVLQPRLSMSPDFGTKQKGCDLKPVPPGKKSYTESVPSVHIYTHIYIYIYVHLLLHPTRSTS